MNKLVCPDCGVAMTRHAVRVLEPRSAREEALVDPELGGVVLERHACPECGEELSRRPANRS